MDVAKWLQHPLHESATRLKFGLHAQVEQEERVDVGLEFDAFDKVTRPVAGLGVDTDQAGVFLAYLLLHGGRVLKGVGGDHAVIVVGSGDQDRGVAGAGFNVVERRVFDEGLELLGVVARAVLGRPVPTDGEFMEAQHVHDAHGGQAHPEEVGALVHDGSDQETAVGAALDG